MKLWTYDSMLECKMSLMIKLLKKLHEEKSGWQDLQEKKGCFRLNSTWHVILAVHQKSLKLFGHYFIPDNPVIGNQLFLQVQCKWRCKVCQYKSYTIVSWMIMILDTLYVISTKYISNWEERDNHNMHSLKYE